MIRYTLINEETQESRIVHYLDDAENWEGKWIIELKEHSCRGCQVFKLDTEKRTAWYGVYTGHYCEDCYENDYPYIKERYPTIEHDGYGERLNEDY